MGEDAKKAAAAKVTATQQAEAAEKSPEELHALEAKAFREAAALKIKEGEALAKVADAKKGNDLKKEEDKDIERKGAEAQDLAAAKDRLKRLVEKARDALAAAKAKPFDKAALQVVIDIKKEVQDAKATVIKMSADVKAESATIKKVEDKIEHKHEAKPDIPRARDGKDAHAQSKYDKDSKQEEKIAQSEDPEDEIKSNRDIKYWANKKMDWKFDDPLKKNDVMGKIFAIKNMEAQTLTKMNEMNTQVGMNTTGVRAGMMAKGETVIVGGELIKQEPDFHIQQTFQGQKGRDPKTENEGRDPEQDNMSAMTKDALNDHIKGIKKDADDEAAQARHHRRPVRSFEDVTNGVPRPEAPTGAGLKDLQKMVPDGNNAEEKAEAPKEEELGESAEEDDDRVEQIEEQADDNEATDENDV